MITHCHVASHVGTHSSLSLLHVHFPFLAFLSSIGSAHPHRTIKYSPTISIWVRFSRMGKWAEGGIFWSSSLTSPNCLNFLLHTAAAFFWGPWVKYFRYMSHFQSHHELGNVWLEACFWSRRKGGHSRLHVQVKSNIILRKTFKQPVCLSSEYTFTYKVACHPK